MSEELDNDFIPERNFEFRDTMRWWERKRIGYSAMVLVCQISMIFTYYEGVVAFGNQDSLVFSFFFLVAANICYSTGWAAELLLAYYFKAFHPNNTLRYIVFFLGMLLSILVTLIIYHDVYIHHYYYSQFV